ncbi:AraC family transcriptional regulator [Leptospira bouyouniensis]|uniref:AraC family transcriptional regulator n=1 Tax=Leptospira bouyouniensis TaxID=2484911 RepID=A0A7I0HNB8_9LEPT|nr:AraC family transcriptional regulator [Leptospira bouyouniensis]TGL03162.1 AraC family transcriptional regulator [Leptospira bouyouniensis]
MKIAEHSKLYITKGLSIFIGTIIETSKHNHNAIQITLSAYNDFTVEFDEISISTKSIIINSNCNHKLIGRKGKQIVISIENASNHSRAFHALLGENPYREINIDPKLIQTIESDAKENKNLSIVLEKIISHLNIEFNKVNKIDERIKKILNIIENVEEKKISVKKLAAQVALSESRIQHLFKIQIGMSIKKYLLWKRLVDGIHMITSGKDFTEAAYEAGFADSAHMSRTFKQMFGINLFDLFHNSRSVQAIVCKS